MDLRKLKKLIDLVQESGIEELEITEGEERVRINSGNKAPISSYTQAPMAHVAAPIVQPVAAAVVEEIPADEGFVMKSPMVGTFYRASNPESASFVELGQTVSEGETLYYRGNEAAQ